jgi:hypothetical protein
MLTLPPDMIAEDFAEKAPIGTPCIYFPVLPCDRSKDFRLTKIRSKPWLLGHGTVVVKIEGQAGGVDITHITLAPWRFEHGKTYPITTLPDDLHHEGIPFRDKWSLRRALFWNSCQGWWHESISDYWRHALYGDHPARFWSPEPPNPMTRDQILAELGEVVCPICDYAVKPTGHDCRGPSDNLQEQRELQRIVDAWRQQSERSS